MPGSSQMDVKLCTAKHKETYYQPLKFKFVIKALIHILHIIEKLKITLLVLTLTAFYAQLFNICI